ncbi:hypothetical protein GQ457_15G001610 [Hibiscus cannabinus]
MVSYSSFVKPNGSEKSLKLLSPSMSAIYNRIWGAVHTRWFLQPAVHQPLTPEIKSVSLLVMPMEIRYMLRGWMIRRLGRLNDVLRIRSKSMDLARIKSAMSISIGRDRMVGSRRR